MYKSKVVSGDYSGYPIASSSGVLIITRGTNNIILSKRTIEDYSVISQNSGKSKSSVVTRSIIGGVLIGGVGAIAGGLSAKNSNTHTIAIKFKNGKKCVIELDDNYYNIFISSLF